jgi:Nucleotide modification associated domain 3
MPERKALLLRVGIDRGTGGALSPIFADGRFEYVPIPEDRPTRSRFTFATLPSRYGRSLAAFVPRRIAGRQPHVDPDFDAFVYGDAARHKRRQLLRLEAGDFLVFYAGFEPWPSDDIPRLFAIGFLEVKRVHSFTAKQIAGESALRRRFGNTAHFLRDPPDPELALVEGDELGSRLFDRALPLGDGEDRLLRDLAAFGYAGSLRRAVGHWFDGLSVTALEDWLRRGPASLVGDTTPLLAVSATKIRPAKFGRGDLVIDDAQPAVGDRVYSYEDDTFALARINPRAREGRTSLFWRLRRLSPAALSRIPIPDRRTLPQPCGAAVRRLVSSMASHYRIGTHSFE